MSVKTIPAIIEAMRTAETRNIDEFLGRYFQETLSYRYNSGVIRVRVIDPRFEGKSREERDDMVEPYLDQLPLETQQDITTLITFAPSDLDRPPATFREFMINAEFEDPSPSML